VQPDAAAGFCGGYQKKRDIDAAVLGANELVRHANERELRLMDDFHVEFRTSLD
jgi:hypothetical protein